MKKIFQRKNCVFGLLTKILEKKTIFFRRHILIYENKFIHSHIETFNLNIILMKKVSQLRAVAVAVILSISFASQVNAQVLPDDNEFVYVAMDLQGVLDLTLATDPIVEFTFNTIPSYVNGIIKPNVTELRVESTVPWDLYVQAETVNWAQLQAFSSAGTSTVPSTLLEVRVIDGAGSSALSNFTALPNTRLNIVGTVGAGDGIAAGTYLTTPDSHFFRVDYRIVPTLTAQYQAGFYGLNVIYTLAEDL